MTVEPYLALLVWKTRRPVKMVWSRQESLLARWKRHPFVMHYRTGATEDGTILAQSVRILGDGGAYPLLSPRVLFAAAVTAAGPYRVPEIEVVSTAAFTNTVPSSAMRGFGAMQVVLAYEGQMDRLAEAVGATPVEIRERNFIVQGDVLPTGEPIESGGPDGVLLGGPHPHPRASASHRGGSPLVRRAVHAPDVRRDRGHRREPAVAPGGSLPRPVVPAVQRALLRGAVLAGASRELPRQPPNGGLPVRPARALRARHPERLRTSSCGRGSTPRPTGSSWRRRRRRRPTTSSSGRSSTCLVALSACPAPTNPRINDVVVEVY